MPLYKYFCESCENTHSRIRKASEANEPSDCPECREKCQRQSPIPPSTRALETWDNGLMTKAVERPADADRLFRERSKLPRSNT